MHRIKMQLIVAVVTLLIEVAACVVGIVNDNYVSIAITLTLSIGWAIWLGMLIILLQLERAMIRVLEEQKRRENVCNGVKENPFEEFSNHDEDERKRD